jgi:hypothetical protein
MKQVNESPYRDQTSDLKWNFCARDLAEGNEQSNQDTKVTRLPALTVWPLTVTTTLLWAYLPVSITHHSRRQTKNQTIMGAESCESHFLKPKSRRSTR